MPEPTTTATNSPVPTNSASNRRLSPRRVGGDAGAAVSGTRGNPELGEQPADPAFDVVPNRPNVVDAAAGRVVELPVEVAAAGKDRAGITAAHRDDDVGGTDDL